jgi:hypothetical protein
MVALAVLAAAPGRAQDHEAPLTLALTWQDPMGALPLSEAMLADDLRALLAPAGVALAWETIGPEVVTTGKPLRVVLLAAESTDRSEVMGSVLRRPSSRTAWINLPEVERTLGLRRRSHSPLPPGQARALSRALSRVIAHEVVHLAAPELPHMRGGLMAARLGRPFLTAPRVPLSPVIADALRAAAWEGGFDHGPVALVQP